jgi:hypothetical protein
MPITPGEFKRMEHSMELNLFNIAQKYAEINKMMKNDSISECELMYPDIEWDEVKRAFLRCELEYLMRLNNQSKHGL